MKFKFKQSAFGEVPRAERIPNRLKNFDIIRDDDYAWMRDKNDRKVISYIEDETKYTDAVMNRTKDLQEKIYKEIIGRTKETDESYPVEKRGYLYYNRTEEGKQYPIYCRKEKKELEEKVLFDVNRMAEDKSVFIFEGYLISPDNRLAAYFFNETGSYAEFTLKIKDLQIGADLEFHLENVSSMAWANDNKTIFYSTIDESLRSYRIYRHNITQEGDPQLIFEERDKRFSVGVCGSKIRRSIVITSSSNTTTEEWLLSADDPNSSPILFRKRKKDVEYEIVEHDSYYFIRYKDPKNLNSKIYKVAFDQFSDKRKWKEFLAHDENAKIEDIDILKDYLLVERRNNGLDEIMMIPLNGGKIEKISFPEEVYTVLLAGNPEYNAKTFRYVYASLNRPSSLYECQLPENKSILLKQQIIPSGFNPKDYQVERIWATSSDGCKVPFSIVYKKGLKKDGKNPTLLYSYGSYGINSDVYFSKVFYSLIDRGFIFAIAQIRGGSDLGEKWYEEGRLLKKKNTFNDFIACAEKLIADKYTSSNKLAVMGGSAGGLLIATVINMRPELFHTAVAAVPFVDVINTMLDDTLPLTTGEYEEWGNPNEEEYFKYMYSYSPYDNIKAQNYPTILVTGGINDSQVLFHEPLKYVAKLREYKTDDNILLLKMNMESGHGGASGRYDSYKESAFELAFILMSMGIEK